MCDGSHPLQRFSARRLLVLLVVATFVVTLGAGVAVAGPSSVVRDPVLLVHGFNGSSGDWRAMVSALRSHGYEASQIDAIDYPNDASNVDVARTIAREADALMRRTGASHIDIVSHSMGAISSRYYLERLGGAAHINAFVSLAGVNQGTIWAYGCYVLTPCREMVPTSSVLHQINDGFHATVMPRYGAWWSPCDEAIVPRTNAELRGAQNVETACLGHSALKSDPTVLAQVVRFLAAP
jgi:triacylglycerol lipase